MVSRRLFGEKLKAGKILLQEGGAANVHEFPFQGIKTGKRRCTMACHSSIGVELVTLEGEPNSNIMAQRVQKFFTFTNFYNQMDFSYK